MKTAQIETGVAIVGSGFAGSLTAMALRRLGFRVTLLERGRHPRFAIGESSTPLANLLLEELCDRYGLDRLRPFTKIGTWQRTYPEVAVGLKRGFSFFHHTPGTPFEDDERHARQLLVAASPRDEIADTHWYRPDFDARLVEEAIRTGVEYLDEVSLSAFEERATEIVLEGERAGRPLRVKAGFLVDASGPRGFLHRFLSLGEIPLRWLPPTHGLYTHFTGVETWGHVSPANEGEPPFPVDAAALHHVFPGGWIWVLRFNNGVTSAGAALTDPLAEELRAAEGAPAWERLLDRLPSVRAQFVRAKSVMPFVHTPRLAFRSRTVTGRRWALLPSAAGIVDPLLSTGFPLTLLGIHRLVEHLGRGGASGPAPEALEDYADRTIRELDVTERLVGALYAAMTDFELFKRLSLLYFAAASFSETVRRLNRPERAPGFLLCDEPSFAEALRACSDEALAHPSGDARRRLLDRIECAIEPFDVAGLRDRTRRDWYPVCASDLIGAAGRLGASPDEIRALLARSGFDETQDAREPGVRAAV